MALQELLSFFGLSGGERAGFSPQVQDAARKIENAAYAASSERQDLTQAEIDQALAEAVKTGTSGSEQGGS